MKFTKMHGAGNDYIYINGFEEHIENPEEFSIKYSDRHKGIGADGLVLILPSETCDFRMRMFNADGSESEMCGNASRCIGKYVYDKRLTTKKEVLLETLAGVKVLKLFTDENDQVEKVTVNMGEPILESEKIPTTLTPNPVVSQTVEFNNEYTFDVTAVSMGNPHAIVFMDEIANLAIENVGKVVEYSKVFPNRTNVEFIKRINKNEIDMRVWERGSGETMACGTGACAAAVASVLNNYNERKVKVNLLGGTLEIEWNEEDNNVYLTGGATTVFEGEINE